MKTALSCTALLLALPALAQSPAPLAGPDPFVLIAELQKDLAREVQRDAGRSSASSWAFGPDAFVFAGRELETERLVKGSPYCANAVHETVQALADGNRIVKKQSTRLCRDGEGRTRREVQREGGPLRVYLHDPVARESWLLLPESKRAQRLSGGSTISLRSAAAAEQASAQQAWAERMREQAERWREWAGQVAQRTRDSERGAAKAAAAAAKAEPGIVIETEISVREPGASAPQRQRDVRVIRLSELPPMPAIAPLPPTPPMPALPRIALPDANLLVLGGLPRGEPVLSALPAKEIEGLKVNGERSSWTIEAGRIGNEKPIVITREVWRSPELMLTVASKDSDPRSGEISYRLEGIKRGEPDAALMRVPADYQRVGGRSAAPAAPSSPVAPTVPRPSKA